MISGNLPTGGRISCPGQVPGKRARLFLRFYQALHDSFGGEEVAIYNWLRRYDETLGGIPLLLIVDDGRLQESLEHIERHIHTQHDANGEERNDG